MKTATRFLLALVGTLAAPSVADAGTSCVPGFAYGVFGKNGVDYGGNSGIDAWNSSAGSYTTTKSGGGDVGTDSTVAGAITLHGTASTIYGNVYYGAGGTSSSLTINGKPKYGTSAALGSNLSLTSVTVPALTSLGAFTTGSLTENYAYTTVSGAVTLHPGTYVIGSLTGDVTINSGPVTVYVTSSFNPTSITNNTKIPGNLVFMVASTVPSIDLTNLGGYFALYAPDSDVTDHGNKDIYGAIVSKSFTMSGTAAIHYDKALASLSAGGFSCSGPEISRASPTVATISGTVSLVQGTFAQPSGVIPMLTTINSVARWTFPYITGHMRARVASTVPTGGTPYNNGTIQFDAATTGKIPPISTSGCTKINGSCRYVFTNTNSIASDGRTFHPTRVQLNDGNANTIGALIAPASIVVGITSANWQSIVRTVLSATLGGVDRSTVAVVGPSTFAGVATRPTIVYFGATDGMLHAVCASTGGTTPSQSNICPSLGTELWAFIPGTQLSAIRTNTARVDGSIQVLDAYGDVVNDPATGARAFHTIITFHTGSSSGTPAAYALDVTDPANPTILWEYATPPSPAAQDFGVGLVSAAGTTLINGQRTNLAVIETNNGGTGGAGVVLTALSLETGAKQWQFTYAFPTSPRGGDGDLPYPTSGIPGGAVGVDLAGHGFVTDFVFGDLYGDLWRVDAATGGSTTGATTPLFSFTSDLHPIGVRPAVFKANGTQYVAFASGGYADPTNVSWSTSTNDKMIAVKLTASGAFPLDENATTCQSCNLMFATSLTAPARGFSQALVVGNQLFVTLDDADVNSASYGTSSSGHLMTFNLANVAAGATTVVLRSGVGSLANSGTTLYAGGSDQQQQISGGATSTTGSTVDVATTTTLTRRLWLRTQ